MPNLWGSLRSKYLVPLLIGVAATAALGAFFSYQLTLKQLQSRLIEESQVLATTINEISHLLETDEELRFAVDIIVRKGSGIRGMTIATKDPFVIWASRLGTGDAEAHLIDEMLKTLSLSTNTGRFGHYFESDGDLVALNPLWPHGSGGAPAIAPNMIQTLAQDPLDPSTPVPFVPSSQLELAPKDYRGAVYMRLEWATLKKEAVNNLLATVSILAGGLMLVALLAYLLLRNTVIGPLRAIEHCVRLQEKGDESARVSKLKNDEIGRLGSVFNEMLDSLNERDRVFRTIVDYLPVAVALKDSNNDPRLSNKIFNEWFNEVVVPAGDQRHDQMDSADDISLKTIWSERQVATTGVSVSWEESIDEGEKDARHFLSTLFPIEDNSRNILAIGFASIDITDRKQSEKRMEQLAFRDPLTRVPNRHLFFERLQQALFQAEREKGFVGLLYLDLDGFKATNDELGHAVGDAVLRETAKRLSDSVRKQDTVARMGGDEFTVIVMGLSEPDIKQKLEGIAKKFCDELRKPFYVAGHEISLSVSIGISIYPEHGANTQELVERSDMAMYHSKKLGRNRFCFFEHYPGDLSETS